MGHEYLMENLFPISSFIISIGAFIISIGSLFSQIKHNKKSVRPIGYVKFDNSGSELSITIVNRGCGPMCIKDFKVVDTNFRVEKNIINFFSDINIQGVSNYLSDSCFHTNPIGYWLTPDDDLTLFSIKGDITNLEYINFTHKVRNILKNLKIVMTFTDIYDSKFQEYNKDLKWFE